MTLSPQQERIYQHMKEQSAIRPYKEMAKELKIKPALFRSQLTKLRDMDLVESTDRESQHWVITSPAEKSVNGTVNGTGEGDESTLSHFVQ